MAKKSTNTRTTSSPLRIQKEINGDYAELGRDYKKLGLSLWRKPATKYVLGGIGLAFVAPYLFKSLKKISFSEMKDKWISSASDSQEVSAH